MSHPGDFAKLQSLGGLRFPSNLPLSKHPHFSLTSPGRLAAGGSAEGHQRHGGGHCSIHELEDSPLFSPTPHPSTNLSTPLQPPGLPWQLGGVAERLQVDPRRGISGTDEDIARRQLHFGANTYPEKPGKTFWYFVWEAMQDTLVQILFVCAIASIAVSIPAEGSLEGLYDGLGIFIALFLIITVAAISNYRQALQFQKLNREKQKIQIEVTRSGRRCKVWIDDLVVGDIIHLSTGDHVPTDGVVMEGHSLAVNESSITGESENMHKDEANPFILAGCTIMDGFGEMMVTAVGMRTEWGKVLATITEDSDEPTPLQVSSLGVWWVEGEVQKSDQRVRLTKVAELLGVMGNAFEVAWHSQLAAVQILQTPPSPVPFVHHQLLGIMGITVGVLIFLILSIRYLVTDADFSNFTADDVSVLLSYFTIAITVLVIAVPEGLPLAVTLTLAFSVTKMMEDNSLVRHLQSCETMGCATTICSDKTGTLTLNEMTVVQAWVAGDFHKPHTVRTGVSTPVAQLLYQAIAVNTSGSVDEPPGMPPVISGSPTEKAILAWGVSFGMHFHETKEQCEVVAVQPFSSTRKRMGVLIRTSSSPSTDSLTASPTTATTGSTSSTGTAESTTPGSLRVHWKGAAEVVLQHCGHYVNSLGSIVPLTEPKRMELERALRDMGKEALRTLGFAFRDFDKRTGVEGMPKREDGSVGVPEDDLVYVGFVGIKDPCRVEVPDSVQHCQNAGIVVRMVTGDSVETATAIATECGILTAGGTVMDGAQFRAIHENDLPATVDRLQVGLRVLARASPTDKLQPVLARASPTDKLQLVRALKEMGHVVAVTGDGTNDAPALHEADIGLAMGQCGTEVAKESADIIILDDNFASIVRTVVWGRSVFANIQRFLQFQITVNCVALTLNFISAVVTGDAPLTAVQMLWVDLIQDTLGALALATEPPSDKLLEQPPVGRSQELVSAAMWRNIIGQTVYQLSLLCVLWFKGMELLQLPGPPGVPRVIAKGGEEISEGEKQLVTIIFSSFVFMQIFNQLNSRKLEEWNVFEGLLVNRLFILIVSIELSVQVLLVELLGKFAGCVRLTLLQWALCFALGAGCVPFGMLSKLIPLPGKRHARKKILGIGMQWPPLLLTFESAQKFLLPCAPSHSHAPMLPCTGGRQGDWDAVAAIAAAHPCVIPSFGLHPWYVHCRSAQWLQHLEERLSAHPHAAMGEAGLHRSRKASSGSSGSRGAAMEEQVEVMCAQLQLARRLHRPIALHCVQAYGNMLTALQQHGPFPAGVILHSFNGPSEMISALVSLNTFFSFSRLSASSPPHKLSHLLHQVPLDRLLLETDSPDGLPPARRKGGEGSTGRGGGGDGKARRATIGLVRATIGLVCEMVASSMGRSKDEVAEAAFANTVRLFSYPGSRLSSLKTPKTKE
ncbi:unnamed protein product [Closterium sp. Naga37s-1]|nr:unnamed protein product [Closterium sp. Naga37s-1]